MKYDTIDFIHSIKIPNICLYSVYTRHFTKMDTFHGVDIHFMN